jgi:Cu(I)/Ag(I) efflux system membrane fusion protein
MKPQLIVTIAATLVAGVAIGFLVAKQQAPSDILAPAGTPSAVSPTSAPHERRVLYWHDPMVPGAKFDKPGKSPFMDMDLVPVYADEADTGGAVRVPANVAQNLGIRLGTVEMAAMRPRLETVGSVAFDETLLTMVTARVDGYVARLHVKAPLVGVNRGQPLADIVAPDWLAAEEEYLALLDAASGRGQEIRDSARRRLTVLGVPEPVIRRIETERRTVVTTTLVAPIDGVVTELAVREGASFATGGVLFRINGLERVWVNAQVPEAQVAMIPGGASVEARATAWPGTSFTGRVEARLPDVDPESRTLPVRVVVENAASKLVPGMFVQLRFVDEAAPPRVVVPSEAVIVTGERSVVIVARDDGGFDVVDVTTGAAAGGRTTVLAGLEQGQRIVLSGQFLIDSEASLKSAVTRLQEDADMTSTDPAASSDHATHSRAPAETAP